MYVKCIQNSIEVLMKGYIHRLFETYIKTNFYYILLIMLSW